MDYWPTVAKPEGFVSDIPQLKYWLSLFLTLPPWANYLLKAKLGWEDSIKSSPQSTGHIVRLSVNIRHDHCHHLQYYHCYFRKINSLCEMGWDEKYHQDDIYQKYQDEKYPSTAAHGSDRKNPIFGNTVKQVRYRLFSFCTAFKHIYFSE